MIAFHSCMLDTQTWMPLFILFSFLIFFQNWMSLNSTFLIPEFLILVNGTVTLSMTQAEA